MDDEFGDDADFSAAISAVEKSHASKAPLPTPATPSTSKVQQPKPQALPSRTGPSSILVSARQKGNPLLSNIRSLPWEYSDIPSDFVLGATTCALFLSLKYDRLHPHYIYTRIQQLGGKYKLRILLTLVDIDNHEKSLKELSKTSLINNLTLILCWSAAEAGRYLELYKSYENASPTSIRAHQSTSYSDKLIDFITVPRSINKTDAVSLISAFGSVRAGVNASPEEIATVPGWGEKKVQRWCGTVREPFRARKAARRGIAGLERGESTGSGLGREESTDDLFFEDTGEEERMQRESGRTLNPARLTEVRAPDIDVQMEQNDQNLDVEKRLGQRVAESAPSLKPGRDDENASLVAASAKEERVTTDMNAEEQSSDRTTSSKRKTAAKEDELSEGMMAALAKLRDH